MEPRYYIDGFNRLNEHFRLGPLTWKNAQWGALKYISMGGYSDIRIIDCTEV